MSDTVRLALATAMAATAAAAAMAAGLCACGGGEPRITLTADRTEGVAADGITPVTLTAQVSQPDFVDAVTFTIEHGFGDLNASRVPVDGDGRATVLLYPPRETELQAGDVTTVKASIPLAAGKPEIAAAADIGFVVPPQGDPVLLVVADPPFVTIGSGVTMKLKIEGRRLTSSTVTLSASGLDLPSSVTLEGDGAVVTGELDIPTPATPQNVDITVAGGGAEDQHVVAHFSAEGAAAFDIDGVFAQVSFGMKRISNYGMLKNDPDCVAADAISLVRVTHTADGAVTMHSESCVINMPTVAVNVLGFDGEITPVATAGFIAATNLRAHDIGFTLDGASFNVPAAQLLPLVVGAELTDPARDPLPTDGASDAQSDDDGDGNPGVTIPSPFFPVPDTFLCSRTFTDEMAGDVESSTRIHGMLTTRSESVTFGSSFGSPTIDDAPSPFHLLRVDGAYDSINIAGLSGNPNEITCDDVVRYADDVVASFERPALVCE